MGKKVKKVVKSVSKAVGKVLGAVTGASGMQKAIKDDTEARRKMEEEALQARRDAAADLTNRDVADVNIGAGADAFNDPRPDPRNRRRKSVTSLSESIGLRV